MPCRLIRGCTALAMTGALATAAPNLAPGQEAARSARARQLLTAAAEDMGGVDALRAIRSLRLVGSFTGWSLGQEEWPGGAVPLAFSTQREQVFHLPLRGWWSRFAGGNTTQPTLIALPDRGMVARDTLRFQLGPSIQGVAALDFLLLPHPNLLAALDAPDRALTLLHSTTRRARRVVGVRADLTPGPVTLWIDEALGRLAAVEWPLPSADPGLASVGILGRRFTVEYATWIPVRGLRLPSSINTFVDDQPVTARALSSIQVNPPGADTLFQVDPRFTFPAPGPDPAVVELAPGLLRLESPSHNVMAVRLDDGAALIEAPRDDGFVRAVLDSIRGRWPGVPIRTVVVTHHHHDHVGGMGAAFAAGLTALAPAPIVDFVRALGPRGARVVAVADSMTVGSGPNRFVLYQVPSPHAGALLMAFFPDHRLLYEVDLAGGPSWDQRALLEFVERKQLPVERMARVHWPVGKWADWAAKVPKAP